MLVVDALIDEDQAMLQEAAGGDGDAQPAVEAPDESSAQATSPPPNRTCEPFHNCD